LGKQISILLGYFVQSAVIYTESEGSVFLFGEYNRCTSWRLQRSYKSFHKIFVNEILDYFQFGFGLFVDGTVRWHRRRFERIRMIVRMSWRKLVGVLSGEDFCKIKITLRNMIQKLFKRVFVIENIGRNM
jgi:hypothetical protein